MLISMTGYGRAEENFHGRTITVELRSVNHRFLDCSVRIPRIFLFVEEQIKAILQKEILRGKVEVFVTLEGDDGKPVNISVNRPVADGYFRAYEELASIYGLENDLTVSQLAKLPDVLLVEKEENLSQISGQILSVLRIAIADFQSMGNQEGEKLYGDLSQRGQTLLDILEKIKVLSPKSIEDYQQKLESRMSEILADTQIEQSRILTEVAIFADKIAISEEIVRLESHLQQLQYLLNQGGAVGRKIDFLIQELNREANTIGSKCSDIEISHCVVAMKAEIEKMREQIQNVV